MKPSSLLPSFAAAALLAAQVFAAAQSPAGQNSTPQGPQQPGSRPMRNYPVPTNLKVLPKDTTPAQLHDIMETWAGSLGVHCDTCHMADPKNVGPNGRPRLNFANDSKEEKQTARLMYTMTEDINVNYVSKVPNSDEPVTCGTCHRGHLGPEPFIIPPDEHGGPRPPQGQLPAGATPQAPH